MATTQILTSQHTRSDGESLIQVEPVDDGRNVQLDITHVEDELTGWFELTPDEALALAAALTHYANELYRRRS